ncbi:MAG: hypothetical protein AAF840_14625, partial [Bacteroidota bacterium]
VGRNLSGSEIPFGGGTRMTGGVEADIHGSLNWKNPGDSQTIPVEVVTPGNYTMLVEAEEPVEGATLKITVGRNSVKAPLRREGSVWSLGSIQLETGEQDLTIELVENAPGSNKPFKELELLKFVR